ncbi:MAG: porin family protein [Leeuwenhoekiella sp.]
MKKIIFLLVFLFVVQLGHAQLFSKERLTNLENFDKQRWSWGFFFGLNGYDYKFDYEEYQQNDILVNQSLGFNVGLLGNMRINDYLDLRLEPGLVFTRREILFPGQFASEQAAIRESSATYIHVPLLLKVSTKRLNNFKPFIIGGVSYSYNLSSNEDNPDDNFDGQFRTTNNTYYYELGLGIDFYLYYFKFTPSIRGVFALNNELIPDEPTANPSPYTGNVDKMASRGIFINLTFQ